MRIRGVYREIVTAGEILAVQGRHPLRGKGFGAMLGAPGFAATDQAGRETPGDVERAIGLAQQRGTTFGGHPAAVEKAGGTAASREGYRKREQTMR